MLIYFYKNVLSGFFSKDHLLYSFFLKEFKILHEFRVFGRKEITSGIMFYALKCRNKKKTIWLK